MSLYRVTADSLHLRKAPSLTGEIIDQLAKDTVVWGTHNSEDEKWLAIEFGANQKGWISCKYITPIQEECPSWLEIATKELKVKEYPGTPDNPRIVEYLKTTTLGSPDNSNDETAWCSSFVNWCIKQAYLRGTDNAMAQSWLNWGQKMNKPRLGCIVVFHRIKVGKAAGHVGFYMGETATHIKVFGGNQHDEVNVTPYEKDGENYKLLGYRWVN